MSASWAGAALCLLHHGVLHVPARERWPSAHLPICLGPQAWCVIILGDDEKYWTLSSHMVVGSIHLILYQ